MTLKELTFSAWYIPSINQVYYEQKFLEKYRDRAINDIAYDPLLGWDYNLSTNRIRPPALPALQAVPNKRRILIIGDSFAHGNEVSDTEVFSYLLEQKIENVEVFTMGVGGYGVGQSTIKYLEYGRNYKPDLVIFAVHPPDFIRTALSFFSFSKPLLKVDNSVPEGYRTENSPVPSPQKELARIESGNFWKSRLYYLIVSRIAQIPVFRKTLIETYLAKTSAQVRKAIDLVKSDVESRGGRFMLVDIPSAHVFGENWKRQYYSQTLADLYGDYDHDWIDLFTELTEDYRPGYLSQNAYIIRKDGSFGHLSPVGNELLAHKILDRICDEGYPLSFQCRRSAGARPLSTPKAVTTPTPLANFKPATSTVVFERKQDQIRVVTDKKSPSYAVLSPVSLVEGAKAVQVSVSLNVKKGVLQIGILSKDNSRFLILEHASEEDIMWKSPVLSVRDIGTLMIGNDRNRPGAAEFRILGSSQKYYFDPNSSAGEPK